MAHARIVQNAWTKGEFDPDLSERVDLEHYYASAASAPNCIFHPQGGVTDRGGLALNSDADVLADGVARRMRNPLLPLSVTAEQITAQNGGAVADLVDQDLTAIFTTNNVTSDIFVVCEIDLGDAAQVDAVDVLAFSCTTDRAVGSAISGLFVEYWTGAAWLALRIDASVPAGRDIRPSARDRRFASWPGGPSGTPVVARQWRVVVRGAAGIGAMKIGHVRLWRERATPGAIKLFNLARDQGRDFQLAVTRRNIDVYRRQRLVASMPCAITEQQVRSLRSAGAFDTLLLFNQNLPTVQIVRQGQDYEWQLGLAPFENVPALQPGMVFSGDADEVQELTLTGFVLNERCKIAFGEHISDDVPFQSAAALPGLIRAELAKMPGVSAGVADLIVETTDGQPTVRVTFSGANGGRAWPQLEVLETQSANVVPTTSIVQAGVDASGPQFGETTGWPRCGALAQSRLLVGGFRAAPTSFRASNNGALYDHAVSVGDVLATDSFQGTLDVDDVEEISEIFLGRHLQIFTDGGEWYAEARELSATQPFNMIRTTSHGIASSVPVVFADGATIFVQTGGQTLRDLLFRDAEQSYTAEPLTLLGPQVLRGVIDVAHKSARRITDGNQLVMCNVDGSAALLTFLRSQEVAAASPWSTAGAFRACVRGVDDAIYFAIERDGALWLERWRSDACLDWETSFAVNARTTFDVSYLAGRSDVWVLADGDFYGPLTATDGQIVLPVPASNVSVGLMPHWHLRLHPLRELGGSQQGYKPPGRIFEAEIAVKDTAQLSLSVNGKPALDMPLMHWGASREDGGPLQTMDGGLPTLPTISRLYTGQVRLQGLSGISETPYLELQRSIPGSVHIKSVAYTVAHKG